MTDTTSPTTTLTTLTIEFNLGRLDALLGITCVPEAYFVQDRQKVSYARGYEAVAGPNDTTRQVIALYDRS